MVGILYVLVLTLTVGPVDRLRQGIIRIRGSPQRRETFRNMVKAKCGRNANEHPELLRDMRVRWNSTLAMLERAIELRDAYDGFCGLLAADFERNQLDDNDWQLIRYTKRYLDSFKDFTEILSGEKYPTINNVIPAYNWLFNHLDRFCVSMYVRNAHYILMQCRILRFHMEERNKKKS